MVIPKYIRVVEAAYSVASDSVSRSPWGNVNKSAMRRKLKAALDDNVSGIKRVIKEVYAIVGDISESSTWKYPHHIMRGQKAILNIHGLSSASGYLVSADLPSATKKKAARHLRKHYRQVDQEVPEGLQSVAESSIEVGDFTTPKYLRTEPMDINKTIIKRQLNKAQGIEEMIIHDTSPAKPQELLDMFNNMEDQDITIGDTRAALV